MFVCCLGVEDAHADYLIENLKPPVVLEELEERDRGLVAVADYMLLYLLGELKQQNVYVYNLPTSLTDISLLQLVASAVENTQSLQIGNSIIYTLSYVLSPCVERTKKPHESFLCQLKCFS